MLKVHAAVGLRIPSFMGTDVASNESGNKERIHCLDAIKGAAVSSVVIAIWRRAEAI